jgi:hypothetical protein
LFQTQGYGYVLGETIHRKFEDILLEGDLRACLSVHYPAMGKPIANSGGEGIVSAFGNSLEQGEIIYEYAHLSARINGFY